MKKSVNIEIAYTHIITRKTATFIAAVGVAIGVGVYLFMNSLSSGFTKFSRDNTFVSNAHIKVYVKDKISSTIIPHSSKTSYIINNSQILDLSKKLYNPDQLLQTIKNQPFVINALSLVEYSVNFRRGSSELKGSAVGVDMNEYAKMFNTNKYMIAGSTNSLKENLLGVIIGQGLAKKLSLQMGDNLTISSNEGVIQVLKIVGIFRMGNPSMDEGRCFVNLSIGRQMLKTSADYVTTLYVNTVDPDKAEDYAKMLISYTDYEVENWQISSAELLSADKTRIIMMGSISLTILIVAAFGIYNILSSTINQKINDIAILKAIGFNGTDVIKIFMLEALIMGVIGTAMGLLLGAGLIGIVSNIYMGGPVGYFPIYFEFPLFLKSFILGIIIILCAGYFPAKNAANVDPVSIFRK